MKNHKEDEEKKNKIVSALNYFTSVCFYIVSIINFVNRDSSTGVIYLCLGSTFLCLGSMYLKKDKDRDKDKE